MLFHVTGTEVFVAGSLHFRPTGSQLPEFLSTALASSDECIFESDLDNFHEPDFARYPAGDSLENHISPALFSAASQLWHDIGATKPLSPLKPWYAGIAMVCVLFLRAGNSVEAGIDRQLLNAAKQAGKRLSFLESSSEALQAFDAAPFAEQIAGLEIFLSDPNSAVATLSRHLKAWNEGNIAAFTHELKERLRLLPLTFDGLIRNRNQQWLPQILNAIKHQRRTLIVVGAMHLAGDHSLQQLLKQTPQNYNLVQIRP